MLTVFSSGLISSWRPFRTQQFRLRERRLERVFLQIRRVAVFIENAPYHHTNFVSCAFAQRPVDADAFAHLGDEFGGRIVGADFFGELDQFLDHFLRSDGAVGAVVSACVAR